MAKAAGNSKMKKAGAADKRTSSTRAASPAAKDKAVSKASAKRGGGRAKPAARKGEKKGMGQFLRDVRVEMGKVTWPTRRDLVQSTWVVLVAVAIAATYIFVLDTVFGRGLNYITP